MPITVTEQFGSPTIKWGYGPNGKKSITRKWKVAGSNDFEAMKTAVVTESGTTYLDTPLTDISLDSQGTNVDSNPIWFMSSTYETSVNESSGGGPNEARYYFSTIGQSEHITQSLSTISQNPVSGATAIDFGGAIGVQDSNVVGADIINASYSFEETRYFDASAVDTAFKAALYAITGKVNNATFRDIPEGCCLFLGASGSQVGSSGAWEITFKFEAKPGWSSQTIGSITGISREGYELAWVHYVPEQKDAGSEKFIVQTPRQVNIEKVYEKGDFSIFDF